jgi:hypothetical protein
MRPPSDSTNAEAADYVAERASRCSIRQWKDIMRDGVEHFCARRRVE